MFAFMLHQGTLLFLHRFFHHKDGQWSLDKFSKQGGVGYDALYSVLLILSLLLTVLILITTYAHPHRKKKGGRGLKIIGLILFFFYLLITGFVIGAIIYGNIVADKSYSSKKIAFPFPKENNISLGEKVISL